MNHFNTLYKRYPLLSECRDDIQKAYEALRDSFETNHKMLICGNGGSAADADHWSGELLKGFCSQRALSDEWRTKLTPEVAGNLQNALPCIPLTGFSSLSTAYANDVNPHYIFAQLCWGLAQKGDVLVGISTSGNAENVCLAAQVAQAKGGKVISLTGIGGGKLADLADIAVRVPEKETFKVQELHLPVYHAICLELEEYFFAVQ
ncbi:MAG: SIS domain-containing protein [Lentisphaeraceae bacterium]|nr:SIS domain-containing protein [Lentisphaeraceae bacterium]